MKILLIGSGNRATAYSQFFKDEIVCVADVFLEKAERLIERYDLSHAGAIADYRDAVNFDAVVIATPDYTHLEVMDWAVGTKKPILLEKPVEVKMENLAKLNETAGNYIHGIILGFGLRYTFMYRKIFEILEEGHIGPVVSIEASETLGEIHAAKFFRRWHRNSSMSGGLLNTKCSHDMDILNMIAGSEPSLISSFGSNMLFGREKGMGACSSGCPEYNECIYADSEIYEFSSADTSICPFTIDSDIVDHQVVNILYENEITAVFTLTMHSAIGNRRIIIHGEKGLIEGSFENQEIRVRRKGGDDLWFRAGDTDGSHGGGDKGLCEYFKTCYEKDVFPNQLKEGLLASGTALAAEDSRIGCRTIDFTKVYDYIRSKK